MSLKIGITYDLKSEYLKLGYSKEEVAEFDGEDTIDAIEEALKANGYTTERIGNIFRLTEYLASGKRCDLVFNIAEGMYGTAREAQVPCLLDAYQIPYVFSGPDILTLSLDKALSKQIVASQGINTPRFMVIKEPGDTKSISLKYPLFLKPIGEGTSKGIGDYSLVHDYEALKESADFLLNTFRQPILVEEYLPGREFTVGLLGSAEKAIALAVMEVVIKTTGEAIYSYSVKQNYEQMVEYSLADDEIANECASLAYKAWCAIDGKDAGRVDIRIDAEGKPSFIEVNPLAGLNPVHSDLPIMCRLKGIPYHTLIGSIIKSAINRAFNT
jgi:D-alanine-D-alanine ligase